MQNNIEIPPYKFTAISVYIDIEYSGGIYVRGSLRGKIGNDYYLMPGEYEMRDEKDRLLLQNVTENILELKKSSLITRTLPVCEYKNVRVLELKDLESDSTLNHGEQTTGKEIIEFKELLMKYKTCFSRNLKDLGYTNIV